MSISESLLKTDKKARRLGVTRLDTIGMALCGLLLVFDQCFADEQNRQIQLETDEVPPVPSLDWKQVAPSAKPDVLQMLADGPKGNYEEIRTWAGTCVIRSREHLTQQFVADAFGHKLKNKNDVVPLFADMQYTMSFVIDVASDSIYRSSGDYVCKWTQAASGKEIEIPNTAPVMESSIITSEHYLHFDPKIVWGRFGEIPDNPEAQNKRTAFRDPREGTDRHHFGGLLDPRNFFGFGNALQKSWDVPRDDLQALEGKHGEDARRWAEEQVTVYQADAPGGVWYRLSMLLDNSKTSTDIVWSPEAGFNAVSYVMRLMNNGEQQPRSTIFSRWRQIDGVYVPVWVKEFLYQRKSGKMSICREVKLEECTVNQPIDPSQFTYAGFGMKDGELVKDNIEKAFFAIRNGQPEKLADFGEQYVPPSERTPMARWIVMAVSIVLLLVAVVILRLVRRGGARAA